jgi:hypothetical protein
MPSEQKAREAGTTKIENPFSLYQREAREAGETKTPIVQPLSIVRDALRRTSRTAPFPIRSKNKGAERPPYQS